MALVQGSNLGPYRILGPLGEGGMASVYRAFQPSLSREVAIKVIGTHLASDPGFRARFRREAETLARLEHPNILPVFDFGEVDGQAYIVYRFVSGGTLRDLIGAPLSVQDTITLLEPVAVALDFAHEQGVVHRDVKPGNILLTRDRTPIVADFGLARMFQAGLDGKDDSLTQTNASLGTPAYMAPEQVEGRRADARTDQYALGIVAYQMLTGSVPYSAETPFAVALKHLHEPLPLPSVRNPAVGPAVERVLLRMLAKDPDDRFASCGAAIVALADAARADSWGEDTSATFVAPVRRGPASPTGATTGSVTPTPQNGGVSTAAATPPSSGAAGVTAAPPSIAPGAATMATVAGAGPPPTAITRASRRGPLLLAGAVLVTIAALAAGGLALSGAFAGHKAGNAPTATVVAKPPVSRTATSTATQTGAAGTVARMGASAVVASATRAATAVTRLPTQPPVAAVPAMTFRGSTKGQLGPIGLHAGLVVVHARSNGAENFAFSLTLPEPGKPITQSYKASYGLVNAIGRYDGGVAALLKDGGDYVVDVGLASGPFEITVEQPSPTSVTPMSQTSFMGSGQQVTEPIALRRGVVQLSAKESGGRLHVYIYSIDDLGGGVVSGDNPGFDGRVLELDKATGTDSATVAVQIPTTGPYLLYMDGGDQSVSWTVTLQPAPAP